MTQYYPGHWIKDEIGELEPEAAARFSYQNGAAIGRMVDTPLPEDDQGYSIVQDYSIIPWSPDVPEAVSSYIRLCRDPQTASHTGSDPFYEETLQLVESQLDQISDQRSVIYHEDLQGFAHKSELQGFFDLEMARAGTDLMQLERVYRWRGPGELSWNDVHRGYHDSTGRSLTDEDYVFLLAMALFYYHIRIVRWGTPDTSDDYVAKYLPALREEALKYAGHVDLGAHLPRL